jgi:hypothetical protein
VTDLEPLIAVGILIAVGLIACAVWAAFSPWFLD